MSHPPDPSPPRRRPTIVDVARRAGVSAAAVSFAVNDRPGVSSGTRERILAAARELGWQPSASARALTEARTRAVGLVIARDAEQLETDSFFLRFLAGIERALTAADYALLLQLVQGDASDTLRAYERLARAGRVDGFLLTDVEVDDPRFEPLAATGVPVVLAGEPSQDCSFQWLETRHAEGIAPAVTYLAGLGHTRIAFFGGSSRFAHERAREAAWREAVPDASLVARVGDDPRAAALALLDGEPSAVICSTDALAIELLAAARSRGVAIPAELSVVGFDDSALAALSGLTSVRVDYAAFGCAAAETLLALVAGGSAPAYEPEPPSLVVRGSTGRVPS